MNQKNITWLLNSRAYKKANGLVDATLRSPQKLLDLVAKAQLKISNDLNKKFEPLMTPINSLFRLLKAYSSGQYRDISLQSLVLIVASIIYFIMPIDVVPDFILVLGHMDDAALLAWTIRSVSADLDRFIAWEEKQKQQTSTTNIEELE